MSAPPPRLLAERFGERLREGVLLAGFTSFKVGGPADWFLEPSSVESLSEAVKLARADGVPVTVLGGGSNVLISDTGIRGLVIRPRHKELAVVAGSTEAAPDCAAGRVTPVVEIRTDAGVTLNGVVRWTIARGLAGLEAFAGTPGTVGGAIYGNAHFEGMLISDRVTRALLLSRTGELREAAQCDLGFGYDRSRLQRTGEVLLRTYFRLTRGAPAELRAVARRSLAKRKRTQPLEWPSAGCVFQNPSEREMTGAALGMPASAGALIDGAGLKGATVARARISDVHANFFINLGGGTAADLRALIELAKKRVFERFGIALVEEIVYLGEF